ncbi:hypothetical protein Vretimale_7450, partial [Volvox reticuliferus]
MDRPPPAGGSLRATQGERLLLSASTPIWISRSSQLSSSSSCSLGPYPRLASVVNKSVLFRRWGRLPCGLIRPAGGGGGGGGGSMVRLPAASAGAVVPRFLWRKGPMGQCGGPPWSCPRRLATHRASGARAVAGGEGGVNGGGGGGPGGGNAETREAIGSGGGTDVCGDGFGAGTQGAGAGGGSSPSGRSSSGDIGLGSSNIPPTPTTTGFGSSSNMSVTAAGGGDDRAATPDSVGSWGTDSGRGGDSPGGLRSGETGGESGCSLSGGEVAAVTALEPFASAAEEGIAAAAVVADAGTGGSLPPFQPRPSRPPSPLTSTPEIPAAGATPATTAAAGTPAAAEPAAGGNGPTGAAPSGGGGGNGGGVLLSGFRERLADLRELFAGALEGLWRSLDTWYTRLAFVVGLMCVIVTAVVNAVLVPVVNVHVMPTWEQRAAAVLRRDISLGRIRWVGLGGVTGVVPLVRLGPVAVGPQWGGAERSHAALPAVSIYLEPLTSLVYRQAVMRVHLEAPQVTVVQGPNFSWFGYPEDTPNNARNFVPGLGSEAELALADTRTALSYTGRQPYTPETTLRSHSYSQQQQQQQQDFRNPQKQGQGQSSQPPLQPLGRPSTWGGPAASGSGAVRNRTDTPGQGSEQGRGPPAPPLAALVHSPCPPPPLKSTASTAVEAAPPSLHLHPQQLLLLQRLQQHVYEQLLQLPVVDWVLQPFLQNATGQGRRSAAAQGFPSSAAAVAPAAASGSGSGATVTVTAATAAGLTAADVPRHLTHSLASTSGMAEADDATAVGGVAADGTAHQHRRHRRRHRHRDSHSSRATTQPHDQVASILEGGGYRGALDEREAASALPYNVPSSSSSSVSHSPGGGGQPLPAPPPPLA